MKVVPDTMIWVSYSTRKDGYRHRLIGLATEKRVRLFTSSYILNELQKALTVDLNLSNRYASLARRAVKRIAREIKLPAPSGTFVPGDPNDDPIVLTAIAARADYVLTNDAKILAVKNYQGIAMIAETRFEELLMQLP